MGAAAKQTVQAQLLNGAMEEIFIEAVLFQPQQGRWPALKVVSNHEPPHVQTLIKASPATFRRPPHNGDDDPGPSAA